MRKADVTTITTDTHSAQVLPRDTGNVLKVKTGLKAGIGPVKIPGSDSKATPILF